LDEIGRRELATGLIWHLALPSIVDMDEEDGPARRDTQARGFMALASQGVHLLAHVVLDSFFVPFSIPPHRSSM